MTEPTPETPTPDAGTRGRPRPDEVVQRDAAVLAALQAAGDAGLTRPKLAEATSLPGNQVYLSLYRLKRDGKADRAGGSWKALAPAA